MNHPDTTSNVHLSLTPVQVSLPVPDVEHPGLRGQTTFHNLNYHPSSVESCVLTTSTAVSPRTEHNNTHHQVRQLSIRTRLPHDQNTLPDHDVDQEEITSWNPPAHATAGPIRHKAPRTGRRWNPIAISQAARLFSGHGRSGTSPKPDPATEGKLKRELLTAREKAENVGAAAEHWRRSSLHLHKQLVLKEGEIEKTRNHLRIAEQMINNLKHDLVKSSNEINASTRDDQYFCSRFSDLQNMIIDFTLRYFQDFGDPQFLAATAAEFVCRAVFKDQFLFGLGKIKAMCGFGQDVVRFLRGGADEHTQRFRMSLVNYFVTYPPLGSFSDQQSNAIAEAAQDLYGLLLNIYYNSLSRRQYPGNHKASCKAARQIIDLAASISLQVKKQPSKISFQGWCYNGVLYDPKGMEEISGCFEDKELLERSAKVELVIFPGVVRKTPGAGRTLIRKAVVLCDQYEDLESDDAEENCIEELIIDTPDRGTSGNISDIPNQTSKEDLDPMIIDDTEIGHRLPVTHCGSKPDESHYSTQGNAAYKTPKTHTTYRA